jgi:hypothetical protein
MSTQTKWISVKKRLPKLDQIVVVCFPSKNNGEPIYAWGARLDDAEGGWLWGVGAMFGLHVTRNVIFNEIEADDDYPITHWKPLDFPPFATKGQP